jgi:hypothetical protein
MLKQKDIVPQLFTEMNFDRFFLVAQVFLGGTCFSWWNRFFLVRWFPKFQVATMCFSCSPPEVNLVAIL